MTEIATNTSEDSLNRTEKEIDWRRIDRSYVQCHHRMARHRSSASAEISRTDPNYTIAPNRDTSRKSEQKKRENERGARTTTKRTTKTETIRTK